MAETLLRSNRRAASMLCVAAAWPAVLGLLLLAWGRRIDQTIISWTGVLMVLVGVLLVRRQLVLLIPPRLGAGTRSFTGLRARIHSLAGAAGRCRVFFYWPSAQRVARGASDGWPSRERDRRGAIGRTGHASGISDASIRSLGKWCDGYITIFGVWCEPLDGDFVNRMNHRLAEVEADSKSPATRGSERDDSITRQCSIG